jgi:LysR family transcriptional regulator, flagellar master operon regulator
MDLALIKTFLEVSETGSFAAASERLFVTQSAVSLRVQRLEEMLGQPLFQRSKTGAEITPSGREFVVYAQSLLRTWEQARQQVAIPAGYSQSLTMGAQASLWPRLGSRFVDALREVLPDLGLRAEMATAETLNRALLEGVMQIALTYQPSFHPGVQVEKVMEDQLVLVAPWQGAALDSLEGRYAFIDWGPEFLQFHNLELPQFANPTLTLAMGAMSTQYVLSRGLAAYLPVRAVKTHLASGALHLVEGGEVFKRIAWSVWRDDLDTDLANVARKALFEVAKRAAAETEAIVHPM